MTGSLLIPENRIDELIGEVPELELLRRVPLVAVSGAMYTDPKGKDKARFTAALETVRSSRDMGVRHIIMLDDSSLEGVGVALQEAGAIVVPVRHKDEGGLARPYLTAARLIDRINRGALMVKVEAEKNIFSPCGNSINTYVTLMEAARRYDIVTGVRGQATLDSMPNYLRVTESVLAMVIRDLTGTYDAASGILALTAKGREIFCQTTDAEWQYLIKTPAAGRVACRSVGDVEIDFEYHPLVVAEENRDEAVDAKRRHQFKLMLDCAVETAGSLNTRQQQSVASARSFIAALERVAERSWQI